VKLGIVGKGGVGKTTTSALLAQAFIDRGRRVVAVDTDSNPNLGLSLGLSLAQTESIPTLPRSLVVGARGDVTSDELIADYGWTTPGGVTLLSALRVTDAGAGCTCGGHATVRSLLGEALADHADVTLVDMEAGLEHLSRSGGTLAAADVLLVVMEPNTKSIVTAARTAALAAELGIPRTVGVGTKARLRDGAFFEEACAEHGIELAAVLPHDDGVVEADRAGDPVGSPRPSPLTLAVDQLVDFLETLQAFAPVGRP
jgi:CO dehydrogenase maturation factor